MFQEQVQAMHDRAAAIANARAEQQHRKLRCDVCQELVGAADFGWLTEVAEVVRVGDFTFTHILVHADGCYNREEMDLA